MTDQAKQPDQFGVIIFPKASPHSIRVDARDAAHANQLCSELAEAIEKGRNVVDFQGVHGPQYIRTAEVFAWWPTKFINMPSPGERLAAAQEKLVSGIVPPREPWQGDGEEKK